MENQIELFFGIEDEKFPQYHKDNPQIYAAFRKYAFQAIMKGHKNMSAEFIFNVIRWKSGVGAAAEDKYKINNNYKAFYSRLFMNENPEYKGFFRIRKSKYDKKDDKTEK